MRSVCVMMFRRTRPQLILKVRTTRFSVDSNIEHELMLINARLNTDKCV